MNNFKIKTIGDGRLHQAEEKANEFIQQCNDQGKRIIDVRENFFHNGILSLYVFVFRVEEEWQK